MNGAFFILRRIIIIVKFDYYYGNEADQFTFYRIPKALFTDEFKGLSCEAKVLYGLMLDRMGLSMKNQWMDHDHRVFIYFTLEEAMGCLGCSHDKGVKLFAELDAAKGIGLIERKKQGLGKPAKIYVKKFFSATHRENEQKQKNLEVHTSEIQKPDISAAVPKPDLRPLQFSAEVCTSEIPKAEHRKTGNQKFRKSERNKNKINKHEFNDLIYPSIYPDTDRAGAIESIEIYRAQIKERMGYDALHPV